MRPLIFIILVTTIPLNAVARPVNAPGYMRNGVAPINSKQANTGTLVAEAMVPRTWLGVPSDPSQGITGVSTLDQTGKVSAPVLAPSGDLGPMVSGSIVKGFRGSVDPNAEGGLFNGTYQTLIGGTKLNLPNNPYQASQDAAFGQSLTVVGRMDGPYSAGYVLGLFDEPRTYISQLAAISGENYTGGQIPSQDAVQFYQNPTNKAATLILSVTAYTANTVTLSAPLTALEILEAHQGAWITTNSLPPGSRSATDATTLINTYSGVIKSVSTDGKTITVYGWSTPGGPKGTPGATNLETYYFKGHDKPVVFIGANTKTFGSNIYMSYDGAKSGGNGTPATSLVHSLEWNEVDMNINNESRANSVSMHGLTITPVGNAAALTRESYDLTLAGAAPNLLNLLDGCGSMAINASALSLPAECNLNLPASASEPAKAVQVIDFRGGSQAHDTPSLNHKIDFQLWLQSGNTGNLGAANAGSTFLSTLGHFGMLVDGTLATSSDQSHAGQSGSNLGDIEWNMGSQIGGIGLCGYATNCGLVVEGGGNADLNFGATIQRQVVLKDASILAQDSKGKNLVQFYPTSQGDWLIGTSVSGGGSIRGAAGVYSKLFSTDGTSLSAANGATPPQFSGQGFDLRWNTLEPGRALTEETNVDPTGGGGGFVWRNARLGSAMDLSKSLLTLKENGAVFGEPIAAPGATFTGDVSIKKASTYWLTPQNIANNLVYGFGPVDSYTAGIKSNIGAKVTFRTSGDLQSTGGTDGDGNLINGTISGLHPDGQGGWQVTSNMNTGGTIAMANYTLAKLPVTNAPNGAQAFCTDCKLNGVIGVYAVFHRSDSKWHDQMNGTLAN